MWKSTLEVDTKLFVHSLLIRIISQVFLLLTQCGVPKKGHVCPYQPKLKRRPDEPPPLTRSAAVQVEMDEFMTLRRLNIKIQGFPESYATEPYMGETQMVVGEPAMHNVPPLPPPLPPDMLPSHPHHTTRPAEMNSLPPVPEIAEPKESRDVGGGEGALDYPEEAPPPPAAAIL